MGSQKRRKAKKRRTQAAAAASSANDVAPAPAPALAPASDPPPAYLIPVHTVPAVRGQSRLERLPIEIHFINPGNLPVCCSTLLACFSPPNLPLQPTLRHILSLPSFRALSPVNNDERTAWFLSRAFLRTEAFIAAFVREVYLKPYAVTNLQLAARPVFDPWLFFTRNPDVCLPASLTHYIYHHYPTDHMHLAEVAVQDLAAGRIERAEQLFAVGAIPAQAKPQTFTEATTANLGHIRGVSSAYASERLLKWKPSQAVTRKVCSCGFDAGAAAQKDRPPTPSQQAMLKKTADLKIDLRPPWEENVEAMAKKQFSNVIIDKAVWGGCISMQHWMLPFNGTVGRYPFPFEDTAKAFWQTDDLCQHHSGLARVFICDYVYDLYRRFAPDIDIDV